MLLEKLFAGGYVGVVGCYTALALHAAIQSLTLSAHAWADNITRFLNWQ